MSKKKKKLYRSRTNRMLFGVCGGIAQYLGVKSKYVRIAYLIFALICSLSSHLSVLPIGIYFILVLAIPDNPHQKENIFSSFFKRYDSQNIFHDQKRKIIRDVKEKDIKK